MKRDTLNNEFLNMIGISYDEFDKLSFDEKLKIIYEYHQRNTENSSLSLKRRK